SRILSLKKTGDNTSAPTKNTKVAIATERGVKGRSAVEASRGKSDSGMWSSPVNLLLSDLPSLRFTKLEKRSPIIAPTPTTQPTSHPRPTSCAHAVVIATDS